MRMIRNSLLIFLLLLFAFFSYSQENDFQTWNSVKLNTKIYKRTDISLKNGVRFKENSTILDKIFLDIKGTHRVKKTDISFSLGYRISKEFNTASSLFQSRYYLDASNKYKYERWRFLLRERLQYQGNNYGYTFLHRQKLRASYNVRKTPFEPFVALESFMDIFYLQKIRYTLGFSHSFLDEIDIDIFYRLQQEVNTNKPESLYIVGVSLGYKL